MPSYTMRIVVKALLLEYALVHCTPNGTQQNQHMPKGVVFENQTDLALKLLRNEELIRDYEVNGSKRDGWCYGDQTHRMPACYQICDEWCWATSVTMTSDYYKGQNYCAGFECAVAGHEFGQQCCPWSRSCHNKYNDRGSACNKGGQDSQMKDAAEYYTGGTFLQQGALAQTELDDALNSGRVIMYTVRWQGGGGHALVIGGCGNGHYYLHDPWGWYGAMGHPQPSTWQGLTYRQLLEYCPVPGGQCGKWVGSIFWSWSDDQGHTAALKRADRQRAANGPASEVTSVLV